MANELVKRFIKKDGSQRISFFREDYADNPRYNTDEPLHCEDWSRDYSIMYEKERVTKSENACKWIRYMLERYGNTKEIVNVLRENAKAEKHEENDDALVYDASRHEWILKCWIARWTDYSGEIHGNCWSEEVSWEIKLKDLDASDIVPYLSDDMIEEFSDKKYFTDGIKIMSYGFGYYGGISFYREFSTNSEGIAWLEKDEFLKYSGCSEVYWKDNDCYDIENGLVDELVAWCNGDVYGFVVEDCIKSKIHKEYTNVDKEDEDYEEEEWEESDSCWGYYGELDKVEGWIFEEYGLNKEDFEEENV